MKLTVILPVTGEADDMGRSEEAKLRNLLHPDTELEFVCIERGFPAIESDLHAVFNGAEIILAAKAAYEQGTDGIFIDCFDDPAVSACRELLPIPVLGGYQPAASTAHLIADRFAILTTDTAGILSEERKAHAFGLHPAAIRAVDMDVLELRGDQSELLRRLAAACISLHETEHVSAVVLGCTGMHGVADALQQQLRDANCPVTVVEPLTTGLMELEMLARLGYSNHLSGLHLAMETLNWY